MMHEDTAVFKNKTKERRKEMGLNDTPSSERIKISFLGSTNAGKSSLVNAVTNQEVALVSQVKGTTTDPVSKSMELLPLGPVVIFDTPGFDDTSTLGEMRIERTKRTITNTNIAVIVGDAAVGITDSDRDLFELMKKEDIPFVFAFNKADMCSDERLQTLKEQANTTLAGLGVKEAKFLFTSALKGTGINELKEMLASLSIQEPKIGLLEGIVKEGDNVVLVCPIDESAPKGRLILPQVQTIRELLDLNAHAVVVTDKGLKDALDDLGDKADLVITDSQALAAIKDIVPDELPLTTFSIIMARYKGFLDDAARGISMAKSLENGSRLLVCEGCTHHRQCNDIGTVKLPKAIKKYTGKDFEFNYTSGAAFPDDLSGYSMVIHCGACMVNDKEVMYRLKKAKSFGIPFTNYGITLAMASGTLERTLRVFPQLHDELF